MKYYNEYYDGTDINLQIKLLVKLDVKNGKILEIGSGQGNLLKVFKQNNVPYAGVEIIDEVYQQLLNDGHNVYKSIYEVPLDDFEYLFMCSVIEHMSFEEVKYLLDNFNGKLVIETPDVRIDGAFLRVPFKNKLSFWDDYQHVKPYTPTSLKRLLLDSNYNIIEDGRVKTCVKNKIKYFILEGIAILNEIISGIKHPYYVIAEKSEVQ